MKATQPLTPLTSGEPDELFRLLVSSVRDYAIFMLDPQGRVATWNAGAARIKGYTADEIIGRHFSTFYPKADIDAGKCEMELDVATREGMFQEEGWRVRKDGSQFWANVVITAVRDAGRLVGFAKVTRDLTERRRAEEERMFAVERARLTIESIHDYAIIMLDPQGLISTWNVGAERIEGYAAVEILGSHFSRFYPAEDIANGKCEMELEVAARDGRFEDEDWRLRKDGSKFWANVVISAVRDHDGHLLGFAKVVRDLSERKRNEEERAARVAAEQANRTKDAFLAMLGHELRNPLAPIVTALQLIKLRGETAAQREYAVIERQVNQMMHLVDDLLDVSRISSGKIELKKKHFDLRETIAKAVEISTPLFERNRHQLTFDVAPGDLIVDGDEPRLTQVVTNLLNNAAKYTEPGGQVRLAARHDRDAIVIEVSDTGIGIDAELLPRVFDLFVQGRQSSDRSAGGLGLGLTLASSLVRLHGGEISAASEGLGRGSTFAVRLPAVHRASGARTDSLRTTFNVSGGKQRVLIVDDNEDARLLLSEILRAIGHDVRTAGDGLEALKLLETFVPEVAVLDIGLPGMDGYELATRMGVAAPQAKLIALSGYGQESDRVKSHAAGFARHLVKPVDIRRLLDSIGELAERT